MNLIKRYREATTPPPGVEVAPRRERWRRNAWMHLSMIISFAAVLGPLAAAVSLGPTLPLLLLVLTVGVFAALAFALDAFVVFPWGVKRFDLIPPWQFRLHEAEEDSA